MPKARPIIEYSMTIGQLASHDSEEGTNPSVTPMLPPIRTAPALDQELHEHVERRADRRVDADLPVRSVTETSMMFMMPMPPTTSEIEAMAMARNAWCST